MKMSVHECAEAHSKFRWRRQWKTKAKNLKVIMNFVLWTIVKNIELSSK